MFTRSFLFGYSGADTIQKAVSVSAGSEVNIDETIPAGSAAQQVALTLDVSQVKGLFLTSNQDLTIKTNSSGSPANTFALAANTPFSWVTGGVALKDTAGAAVTTDITTIYVAVPGATDALLQIR